MIPNYAKTENMLANLERIWLDSKDNELYQLIEKRSDYLIEDNGYFERLFITAVIDYDHDIQIFNLWGCDPTPEELLASFIFKVAKAMAECFKGRAVREKIYDMFLKNSKEIYFSPIGLGNVDQAILENHHMQTSKREDSKFDYTLKLAEFIDRYASLEPKGTTAPKNEDVGFVSDKVPDDIEDKNVSSIDIADDDLPF